VGGGGRPIWGPRGKLGWAHAVARHPRHLATTVGDIQKTIRKYSFGGASRQQAEVLVDQILIQHQAGVVHEP